MVQEMTAMAMMEVPLVQEVAELEMQMIIDNIVEGTGLMVR